MIKGIEPVKVGEELMDLRLNDNGNAQALQMMFGDWIRYCPEEKGWRVFDGIVWRSKADPLVYEMVLETVKERLRRYGNKGMKDGELKRHLNKSENWGSVRNTVSMASHMSSLVKSAAEFDTDINILGVENGVLDLRSGGFRNAKASDWLTMRAGCRYEERAECPRWLEFINQIFNEDKEVVEYIQRVVGYCLTGHTQEQIFFLCWGNGSNGKSTFLEVLKTLVGDYGATAPLDLFDARRKSENTNDLARLLGKRFVTIIESEQDRQLAESKIKSATGEDKITCRFLYGEFFEYLPQFKIWLAANHRPTIKNQDKGIWRRVRMVPFVRTFEEKNEIKGLKGVLFKELPGILNWALDGLMKWRKSGVGQLPETIRKVTNDYKEECDVLGQWLGECVEKTENENDLVMAGDLFKSYSAWMKERELRPKGIKEWGIEMKDKGFEKANRNSRGIRYKKTRLVEAEWPEEIEG